MRTWMPTSASTTTAPARSRARGGTASCRSVRSPGGKRPIRAARRASTSARAERRVDGIYEGGSMAASAVEGLDGAVRGRAVERGASDYDEARALYNAMIDK